MRKILETCPGCGSNLDVTQLNCPECEIVITGRFIPTRFCHLTPENLHFAELFIKLRGNIKDMERELGISYPTVRNRLNEVIRDLGFVTEDEPVEDEGERENRQEILTLLGEGKMDVNEAVERLRKGKTEK